MSSLQYEQQLPGGWHLARFDEFLKRVERKIFLDDSAPYDCVGVRWYGNGAFIRERLLGLNISRKQQWVIKTGDIVYNKLFAWKGSFAIADDSLDGCIVSDKFPTYEADLTKIDSNFLRYYFRTIDLAQQALDLSKGGAAISKLTLNPPQFWDLTIPLPPLSEQRRIVARIEELATRIEEASGLRREAVEEAEALVRAYAQRLLTTHAELTELRCWLDSDRDGIQTGPFGAQLGSHDFESSGVPILSIGNIQYYGLELDNLKFVSEEKAQQLSRFTIKEGDILFARMGTVGRCCVVPDEAEGWLFNYHIIRVALDKSCVDPRYIHWSIRASKDIEQYLSEKIRGATREGVNSSIVGSLPVRIPSLAEQRRIVSYLDDLQTKVDNLSQLQSETSAELDALLPSTLDKAFKGDL